MGDSDEIESLRRENEALRRELKEATIHLAALAHKEYQVPDGSIRDNYQKICRAIESWVDYACSDKDALKMEDKNHKLKFLSLEPKPLAVSDPMLDWLRNLEMLHFYILSLTIGKYIFCEMLMKPYPVGTTQDQEIAFLSIEEEMLRMGRGMSILSLLPSSMSAC